MRNRRRCASSWPRRRIAPAASGPMSTWHERLVLCAPRFEARDADHQQAAQDRPRLFCGRGAACPALPSVAAAGLTDRSNGRQGARSSAAPPAGEQPGVSQLRGGLIGVPHADRGEGGVGGRSAPLHLQVQRSAAHFCLSSWLRFTTR
jgi:hypothetical protein